MHLRNLLITIALAAVGVAAAVTPAGAAAPTVHAAANVDCIAVPHVSPKTGDIDYYDYYCFSN